MASNTSIIFIIFNQPISQVAEAKMEAAHNRRHYRAAMLELAEIKKDLQAKEELIKALQTEAHKLRSFLIHICHCKGGKIDSELKLYQLSN